MASAMTKLNDKAQRQATILRRPTALPLESIGTHMSRGQSMIFEAGSFASSDRKLSLIKSTKMNKTIEE